MASRPVLAVALGRRHLSAALAVVRLGRLQVQKVFETQVPDGIGDDVVARGAWLKKTLDDAGLPGGHVIALLPREQLGFKRLTLPSTDPAELPEMVRLAVGRDLPFNAEGAVIDFLPVEISETSTGVVAYAAPAGVLEETRALYRAAGLRIDRIAPRDRATAALADSGPDEPRVPRLAIDIAADFVSFCVIADGAVRFSRSAPLAPTDPDGRVAALITETRRTWMSYRIVDDAESVADTQIFGDGILTRAGEVLGEVLQMPVRVITDHPLIDLRGHDPGTCWPLLGALLEEARGRDTIDLASPRQAPDTGARRRQVVLGVVGLMIIVLAAVYAGAAVKHGRLEKSFNALAKQAREAMPGRRRYKRDELKLAHARQWTRARVDWLAHLRELSALAPDPSQVVLDGWSGGLDFRGVKYDRKTKPRWSIPGGLRITVDGEATDRASADTFRAALVDVEPFTTTSSGADSAGGKRLPYSFSYILRTDRIPEP